MQRFTHLIRHTAQFNDILQYDLHWIFNLRRANLELIDTSFKLHQFSASDDVRWVAMLSSKYANGLVTFILDDSAANVKGIASKRLVKCGFVAGCDGQAALVSTRLQGNSLPSV